MEDRHREPEAFGGHRHGDLHGAFHGLDLRVGADRSIPGVAVGPRRQWLHGPRAAPPAGPPGRGLGGLRLYGRHLRLIVAQESGDGLQAVDVVAEDPEGGHHRHREQRARRAPDEPPEEEPHEQHGRIEGEPLAHEEGRQHVAVDGVDGEEHRGHEQRPPDVVEGQDRGHAQHDRAHQAAEVGDEVRDPGHEPPEQGIGHPQQPHHRDDERAEDHVHDRGEEEVAGDLLLHLVGDVHRALAVLEAGKGAHDLPQQAVSLRQQEVDQGEARRRPRQERLHPAHERRPQARLLELDFRVAEAGTGASVNSHLLGRARQLLDAWERGAAWIRRAAGSPGPAPPSSRPARRGRRTRGPRPAMSAQTTTAAPRASGTRAALSVRTGGRAGSTA